MAQAHYACPVCGTVYLLTYKAADVDRVDWPPICGALPAEGYMGRCRGQLERAPQPGDFAFDVKTDGEGGKGFQKFTVHRQQPDRHGNLVQIEETIDSVHKLRQIEKDSEQRYRNGEGEPLRFRGYAQNQSNMDVGAFGKEGKIGELAYDSGYTPQKKSNIGITRHGQRKPKVKVAKGGGVSPL